MSEYGKKFMNINLVSKAEYVTDNSDLKVIIHKVLYSNDEYSKVKLTLVNKRNGIFYEVNKKYKLIHKNISHWIKLEKLH